MTAPKNKQKTSNEPPRKAGNKGNFHGSRLAFLESKLPDYYAAVSMKTTPKFWSPTYSLYHQEFDWRIPLDETYPDGHTFPSEEEDNTLDDVEAEKKKAVVTMLNKVCCGALAYCIFFIYLTHQKIYSWFSHKKYVKSAETNSNDNTFAHWLKQ